MEASLPTRRDDPQDPQWVTTGHQEEGVGASLPANLGVAGNRSTSEVNKQMVSSLLGSTERVNKQMEISRHALEEGPRWIGLTSRVNKQIGSSWLGSSSRDNKQMAISQLSLGAEPSDLGLTSRVYNQMEILQHRRTGSWDTTWSLDAAFGCLPRDADLHQLAAVIVGHFVPEHYSG